LIEKAFKSKKIARETRGGHSKAVRLVEDSGGGGNLIDAKHGGSATPTREKRRTEHVYTWITASARWGGVKSCCKKKKGVSVSEAPERVGQKLKGKKISKGKWIIYRETRRPLCLHPRGRRTWSRKPGEGFETASIKRQKTRTPRKGKNKQDRTPRLWTTQILGNITLKGMVREEAIKKKSTGDRQCYPC